jgi:hypothetical protein
MKTVAVQLTEETERQLRTRASENGMSLESLLEEIAGREAREPMAANGPLANGTAWLVGRTTADVDAARSRLLGQRVRPLPLGQSLVKTVEGTWPSNESDAQIAEALERLS